MPARSAGGGFGARKSDRPRLAIALARYTGFTSANLNITGYMVGDNSAAIISLRPTGSPASKVAAAGDIGRQHERRGCTSGLPGDNGDLQRTTDF